jgi:LPS-assembly protein
MLLLSLALLLPILPPGQQEKPFFSCGSGNPGIAALSQVPLGGLLRCSEGAIVTYKDTRVEADWMELDPATNQLTAGDHVRFVRGGERLNGARLSFNLDTNTGTFTEVSGEIEGFYVKAAETERRADDTWHLTKPMATACTGDCPRWRFTWREADITPGERVSGKGMAFRFQNVPLFYLPRFAMPTARKERASGFLIPDTSTSTTKGRSVRQAFFWAINRSYDATLTGEYFSKRGPAGTIDFRGIPNPTTNIEVNTFFAIDREHHGGQRTRIRAVSLFGRNWRGVSNVDITSSFDFRQVYEEGFSAISSPIEQSTGFATRNGARSSLNILYDRSAIFFCDPSEMSFCDQRSTALRKFPSVDLQLLSRDIGGRIPVYFSLDGSFTGMARRDGQLNTPPFVQRIDVHPSIEIPVLRSNLLIWSHQVGVRETVYTHSLDPGVAQKALNRGSIDYTMKITGPQLEKKYGGWRHLVEPTFEYRNVTGIDEFRKAIIVDETDLVTNTNEIEYGVTSRFVSGHEFLTLRVAQKLYFDPTFGGALLAGHRNALAPLMDLTGFAFSDGEPRRFSPLVSTARIATTPQTSTDIEVDYDTQRSEFRSAGILGNISRGQLSSSVGYFFNKRTAIQTPSNQLRGLVAWGSRVRPGISGGFGFYYDIQRSLFQGSTAQVGYNAECFGVSVDFTQYNLGVRRESRLRFSLTLKNLGSVGTLRPQERLF